MAFCRHSRARILVVLALAACILLSSVVVSSALILVLVVLWGAAFGALPVCTQLWIFQAAPQQFEAASAMGMTVFQIALFFGSLSGGIVFDTHGLASAFGLGGSLLLICVCIIAASLRSIPSATCNLLKREIIDARDDCQSATRTAE